MSVIKSQHLYLPRRGVDYSKWAVLAGDQFVYDEKYWQDVKDFVDTSPSTLEMIFPEITLRKNNMEPLRLASSKMQSYYNAGIFKDCGACMILVDRKTQEHEKRLGIIMTVDLEEFSTIPTNPSKIKSCEGSIIGRIPPMVELRSNSIFEFSHIVLLYDDRKLNIAKNLYDNREELEKLYDFDLNFDGGHITGYKIKKVDEVIKKFDSLLNKDYLSETFGTTNELLFLIADGGHALSTAKEHWNNVKRSLNETERLSHPARFALVEAINIHDEGISFEPIHRIVGGVNKKFLKGLKKLYKIKGKEEKDISTQKIITSLGEEDFFVPSNATEAIKLVQDYIDECCSKNLEMTVDYVKNLEEINKRCSEDKNAIGITFPKIKKTELFEIIIKNGALPRKSFTFCQPREKKYYLEAHKIKQI